MLALIAGTGGLPAALVSHLQSRPLICGLAGFTPELPVDIGFRIEHLGSFLKALTQRGVTHVCFAGAVKRPNIDVTEIDSATAPLTARIAEAIAQGDDAALRIIINIFEEAGFSVVGADEIAPDLLPAVGVLTRCAPTDSQRLDAVVGESCVAVLGQSDTGQACLVLDGRVIATEGPEGTAAMIAAYQVSQIAQDPITSAFDFTSDLIGQAADWLSGQNSSPNRAGLLFKAPKPAQDRRADLPLIGPDTALQAAQAGLCGIVIEADGVMVLDQGLVRKILDAQNMFLWVRPRGGA